MVTYSYGGVTGFHITAPGTPAPIGEAPTAPAVRDIPPSGKVATITTYGGGAVYGARAPALAPPISTVTAIATDKGVLTKTDVAVRYTETGMTKVYPLSVFAQKDWPSIRAAAAKGGYVEVGPGKVVTTVTPRGRPGAPYAGKLTHKELVGQVQLVTPAPPPVTMLAAPSTISPGVLMIGLGRQAAMAERGRAAAPYALLPYGRIDVGAGEFPLRPIMAPVISFVAGATIGAAMMFPSTLQFGYEIGRYGPGPALGRAGAALGTGLAVDPAFTIGTIVGPSLFYGGAAAILRPAPPLRVGVVTRGGVGITKAAKFPELGIDMTGGRAALVGASFVQRGGKVTAYGISEATPRVITMTTKPPIFKAPLGAIESASLVYGEAITKLKIPRGRIMAKLRGPFKYKTVKEPIYATPETTPAILNIPKTGVEFRRFWYPAKVGKRDIIGVGELASKVEGSITKSQAVDFFIGKRLAGIGEARVFAVDLTRQAAARAKPPKPLEIITPGRFRRPTVDVTKLSEDLYARPPQMQKVVQKMPPVPKEVSVGMSKAVGAAFDAAQRRTMTKYAPKPLPSIGAPRVLAPPAAQMQTWHKDFLAEYYEKTGLSVKEITKRRRGPREPQPVDWSSVMGRMGEPGKAWMPPKGVTVIGLKPQITKSPVFEQITTTQLRAEPVSRYAPEITLPKARRELIPLQRTGLETITQRDLMPGLGVRPAAAQIPGIGRGLIPIVTVIPTQELRQDVALRQLTRTIDITKMAAPGATPFTPYVPGMPALLFPPIIPGGGLGRRRMPSPFRFKDPMREYRPSLHAVVFDITAPKALKMPLTGLEIRPVVRKRKKPKKTRRRK